MKTKVKLAMTLVAIMFLSGCVLSEEHTAKVTVTKESKGVFIVEIHQGDGTQIFLRYVEFSYWDQYYNRGWLTKVKEYNTAGSGGKWHTTITVDLTKSPSLNGVPYYNGGSVTFVFNDWVDITI